MLASDEAICTGKSKQLRLAYHIERPGREYVVRFGNDIVCKVPVEMNEVEIYLYPTVSPLPMFDPDEPVSPTPFRVVLMPKVT